MGRGCRGGGLTDSARPDVPPPAPVPAGRGGPQRIPRPTDAALGDPAPWAHLDTAGRLVTVDRVRGALAGREPGVVLTGAPAPSRTSAVLVPLYEHDDVVHLVLTRRSGGLRAHSGEIAFPGGRQDDGEALWDTARREAEEEIGLDPSSVERIGQLDHLKTFTSDVAIVPFVGLVKGGRPALAPNPGEVDEILHVDLAELLLDEVWREEHWPWAGQPARPITFFELAGDTVWGATAGMLRQLLSLVLGLGPGVRYA